MNEAAAAAPSEAAISDEEVEALLEKEPQDGVRPFDFNAHRISRTQLPMLESACKAFAERAGTSLTSLLGRDAEMQFDALQIPPRRRTCRPACRPPATLAVVRFKPLPGLAFVIVEPKLLLTLLDGFFGGTGRAAADAPGGRSRRRRSASWR